MPKGQAAGSKATQFRPGNRANPGGRPKGVAAAIKTLVGDDGRKLWHAWYAVAFGNDEAVEKALGCAVKITAADKMKALAELRDSGFGRPVQAMTAENGDTVAVPESIAFVFRKVDDAAT